MGVILFFICNFAFNEPKTSTIIAQRKTWLSLFFQALLLLAFSAVIVLFMPRAETFSYDYELDKPWRYGDIIASHNFPIYKSDQVVSHERDSVMRLYHPYYTLNDTADAQIARFWANYRDGRLGSLSWKYADYVARRLQAVYAAGIMDSDDYSQWQDSAITGIALVDGNTARVVALRGIYTARSASAAIPAAHPVRSLHAAPPPPPAAPHPPPPPPPPPPRAEYNLPFPACAPPGGGGGGVCTVQEI